MSAEQINDEVICKNIFISNVDKYYGKAILKTLKQADPEKYNIYGSVMNSQDAAIKELNSLLVDVLYRESFSYYDEILACEYIIYEIISDDKVILEIENVLDAIIKAYKECDDIDEFKTKYIILITTPMTWARTPQLNDENIFYEQDYRRRRAHPNYLNHKCMEREINVFQTKLRSKVRTLIFCPGIAYGGINDIFHFAFKLAFYDIDTIPVIAPLNQYLPVIYIYDMARMIKQLIDEFPEPEIRYIFGMEPRSVSSSLLTNIFVRSVSGKPTKIKMMDKTEILNFDKELFDQRVIDAIVSNMNFVPTYFESFEFTFNYLEFGDKLADEYRIERNLLPIRILIDGPPCSGKTSLARLLNQHYKIPSFESTEIIDIYMKTLEKDINESLTYIECLALEKTKILKMAVLVEEDHSYFIELQEYLSVKIEEWKAELEEIREMKKTRKSNDFELLKRCYLKLLSYMSYKKNQGYIIDDFPFTYTEISEIFFKVNEEITDEKLEMPHHVFIMDATDDTLINRAMAFEQETAESNNRTEERMMYFLTKYRERNEDDKSLMSFFYDNNIVPISICSNEQTKMQSVFEIAKQEIGLPHIYPLTAQELLEIENVEKHKKELEQKEMNRIREEMRVRIKAEREQNIKKWSKEFERLKQEEEKYLEAQTLPLRHYLSKFVLPILTEGILKVAELKPEDPIDYLAEFFFKYNKTGHVLSPEYHDELKRILIEEGNEDTLHVLNTLADNVQEFHCN